MKLSEFASGVLLNGLSPSTTFSLVINDLMNDDGDWDVNNSRRRKNDPSEMLLNGTSRTLQSALFSLGTKCFESSSFVKEKFASILMEEILNPHSFLAHQGLSWNTTSNKMVDADSHSMSSSIQQHYNTSRLDWSRMEVDATNRALARLRTWAISMKRLTRERYKFITTNCHSKLKEYTPMIAESTDLKRRKRRSQSKVDLACSKIASLEEQLVAELARLQRSMRAKKLLDAHLRLERFIPISALNEEIRSSISPSPIVVGNGLSQFSFRLLGGSVEIVMEMSPDDDDDTDNASCGNGIDKMAPSKVLELGCFIKDGGSSIKMLQAILLGNVEMSVNESMGPYKLRSSIASFIREEPGPREDIIHRSSLIFSRIDALARSVRELEVQGSACNVTENVDGVTLSVSMPKSDTGLIQIDFFFVDALHHAWSVYNLVPSDVDVSIISSAAGAGSSLLRKRMQENARSMIIDNPISSVGADPILLRRICNEMNRIFNEM